MAYSPALRAIWRVADPKITLASVSSLLLGISVAARDGPLSAPWLGLTAVGIFFLEAAKNASGELFDFRSGTDLAVGEADRSPFSGGKRVLVDKLLSEAGTRALAAVFYGLGIGCGLAIVWWREPRVLWLGLVGVTCAFFYHGPPLRLAYRGLGELTVAAVYGPLIATGAYLVQRQTFDSQVVAASVPLGLAIGAFLWVNEFPDATADRQAGKNTLVVQLGRRRAARVFPWIVATSFTLVALLPLAGLPAGVLLGLAGLPSAAWAAFRLLRDPEQTSRIIPAQRQTLIAFLLMAAGMSAGFFV